MNVCPSLVGLGGMVKYFLSDFTFTGIPGLAILYLSTNLVFICFDTKKSSSKYIFALHFFKVGFPIIVFTDTYLQRPNDRSTVFLLTSV